MGKIGQQCKVDRDCDTERCSDNFCVGNYALKRLANTGQYCDVKGPQCAYGNCDFLFNRCLSIKQDHKAYVGQPCRSDLNCRSHYCHRDYFICMGADKDLARTGEICTLNVQCSSLQCNRHSGDLWGICR